MYGFEWALSQLRQGAQVYREGWGNFNLWIVLQEGYPNGIPINANTAKSTGLQLGTVCSFLPYIMLHHDDGSFVPWVASQTDILKCDWKLVGL